MDRMTALLDEYFCSLLDTNRIAGCGLMVRKQGKLIYDKSYGVSDVENSVRTSKRTIYKLASMTKPITAAAVMILRDQKLLSLDNDLLCFFPNFPLNKKTVTVRHLLNHCSGLGQGQLGKEFYILSAKPEDSLKDRTERLGTMPFDYVPGESAAYSPMVGFDILGRIIEIVSGQRLGEFIDEKIFQPLGMTDTSFYVPDEKLSRLAKVYNSINGSLVYFSDDQDPVSMITTNNPLYDAGCGGLKGTLSDYDRFTTMLANGGELDGVRVISEESVELMHTTRQITDAERCPGLRWGLGVMVFEHPERSQINVKPGTFGWSGAYGTHMFINMDLGLSCTFMTSMGDLGGSGSPISRQIERIVFNN